ncbi:MAG: serine/threonine-protein kinase [Vicinamibacterales bacterium]
MHSARWTVIKREFARVQALPPEARDEALASLDAALRDEVASLLDGLGKAAPGLDGDRIGPLVQLDDARPAPARIGPWRVVRTLGRGGMGVVYLGERQADDVVLRAAIKVVAGLGHGADIARRFRAERRILASLDHPGIARLIDGGTTDDGLPYVALEFVEGVPLTDYARAHRLDVRARLALFRQVCDAVAFAHGRLVVHRDLKPGNVLVTADGAAKLLDFGIAKVLAIDGDESAGPATVTAQGWMTPAYASPEQLRGEPTTTVSDVYSLGLMLYELLVDAAAIPRGANPVDAAKVKLEGAIPKPSTAVVRASGEGAGRTPAERARLARTLRGDLDTIVLAALAVEPARRYASVTALADEIDRYASGQPVRARADSVGYRAVKFVGRNRWAVALGTLAAAAMVVGLVASLLGQQRAERAEAEARRSAATADRVSEFMVGLFNVSDPGEARGNAVTARELLDAGATRIARELAGEPDVRARLDTVMARAYGELGLYERQRAILQLELDDAKTRFGEASPQALALMTKLAVPLMRLGRHTDALPLVTAAVTGFESAQPPNPLELGRALTQLATAQWRLGDLPAAKATSTRAIAITASAPDRTDADAIASVTSGAIVRWMAGEYDEARPMYERLLALSMAAYGEDSPSTANVLNNLAILEDEAKRPDAARRTHERALAIRRRILAQDHPDIAETLNGLGVVEQGSGRHAEARAHLEEALTIRMKAFGERNEMVATTEYNLGLAMTGLGDAARARALFEHARSTFVAVLGPAHPYVSYPVEGLGRLERTLGRRAEAERLLAEALALRDAAFGAAHPAVVALRRELDDLRAGARP